MCGIIAYAGTNRRADTTVFEGLKALEYRGYDSWGIAILKPEVTVTKQVGKISRSTPPDHPESTMAMGHTRWATHGAVTASNTHPHFSASRRLVIVHNGIVENFHQLKNRLVGQGVEFRTETDTEVIVNLIEQRLKSGLQQAVADTLEVITGRNAFVVYDRETETLAGARNGSPLVLGLGDDDELFLASDPVPFTPYTDRAILLENNEIVLINHAGFRIIDASTGRELDRDPTVLTHSARIAKKGAFDHFYIKEIHEQSETVVRAVNQDEDTLKAVDNAIAAADRIYFTGAGTAGRVGAIGSYLFAEVAHVRTQEIVSSEFPTFAPLVTENDLVIAISQSGETADTLEAIESAHEQSATVVSIVNVEGSTVIRESDHAILMKAGIEKAVASTKATTAPIAILTLLAYRQADKADDGARLIADTSSAISSLLEEEYLNNLKALAARLARSEDLYVIGRGLSFPVAQEGAVKLQELPYIHAEGIAGAELKHYAITLIEDGVPCVVLVPNDRHRDLILGNAAEIALRGGTIIGIGPENHDIFDHHLPIPDTGQYGFPILGLVPMQILAYYLTLERGHDPDYCRNLAKSVTVK